MVLPLLLGPQVASQVPLDPMAAPEEEFIPQSQIDVTADRGGVPEDYNMNNTEQIMSADDANRNAEEMAQREGMFGVKGTLRDVLGILGDAFLVQSGNSPIYMPTRRQEMVSDAMSGYTSSPREAIERVARIDPNAALELANRYGIDLNNAMTHSRAVTKQRADMVDENSKRYERGATMFGQIMGALDKDTYERFKPLLQRVKEEGGLGEEFFIPDEYDQSVSSAYANSAMTTHRQITTEQGQQRIDETRRSNIERERDRDADRGIKQQNADSSSRRATVAEKREARMSKDDAAKKPGVVYKRSSDGKPVIFDANGNERVLTPEQAAALSKRQ